MSKKLKLSGWFMAVLSSMMFALPGAEPQTLAKFWQINSGLKNCGTVVKKDQAITITASEQSPTHYYSNPFPVKVGQKIRYTAEVSAEKPFQFGFYTYDNQLRGFPGSVYMEISNAADQKIDISIPTGDVKGKEKLKYARAVIVVPKGKNVVTVKNLVVQTVSDDEPEAAKADGK